MRRARIRFLLRITDPNLTVERNGKKLFEVRKRYWFLHRRKRGQGNDKNK